MTKKTKRNKANIDMKNVFWSCDGLMGGNLDLIKGKVVPMSEEEWREYGRIHGYSQYFTNKYLKEKDAELLSLLKEALDGWEDNFDCTRSEYETFTNGEIFEKEENRILEIRKKISNL